MLPSATPTGVTTTEDMLLDGSWLLCVLLLVVLRTTRGRCIKGHTSRGTRSRRRSAMRATVSLVGLHHVSWSLAAALLGGNCFVGATPKGKLTDSEFKLASWGTLKSYDGVRACAHRTHRAHIGLTTARSFPSPPPHYMYTLVSLVYTLSPHMDTVSLSRLGPELAGHDRGDGQVGRNQ